MEKWKIDVPVLLIFFNRPNEFRQVFESVREARPSILMLWQDGPRAGREDDFRKTAECRKIVEDIDWECKVYRNYHNENMGCDPSTFLSHKWAFSIVSKCIVLEDDFVANQDFYVYCKELLDRYEFDERINHICGFNMLGAYEECPYDYFFSYTGSNAWASWKRVIDGWDESYQFLSNEYFMKNLRKKHGKAFNLWRSTAQRHKETGKSYWESILCFDSILNARYAIIPKVNMVINVGMTADSTHSSTEMRFLTKTERKLFYMKQHEMTFPLKHPPYIVPDFEYTRRLNLFYGIGHPFIRLGRKIYRGYKYLVAGVLVKKALGKIEKKG